MVHQYQDFRIRLYHRLGWKITHASDSGYIDKSTSDPLAPFGKNVVTLSRETPEN
tara:strand:+ start:159 stop:323 length:165 start_codon:yes stop_codon:yes gene_type:complete